MRLWSIHPKYLDSKGLVALWRETLLAKHVLAGHKKGYKNHPQLDRFKASELALDKINQYLSEVFQEAVQRGYNFNKEKIDWNFKTSKLKVTKGQMKYERTHLLNKLQERDLKKYEALQHIIDFEPHPLFTVVSGEIESWEIL